MEHSNHNQDKFLFSLIKQENRHAFDVLFRYYYSGLVVFAMRYVQSQADAEEIVQDVFLKLWSEREKIQIHTSVRDFLFQSVKNKCLDRLKHKKVKEKFTDFRKQQEKDYTSYDIFVEQELRELIKQTMEKLPEQCRKVFVLNRIQNLKYKDVATKLGISVKTVEKQMSKALKVFREALKDYL